MLAGGAPAKGAPQVHMAHAPLPNGASSLSKAPLASTMPFSPMKWDGHFTVSGLVYAGKLSFFMQEAAGGLLLHLPVYDAACELFLNQNCLSQNGYGLT